MTAAAGSTRNTFVPTWASLGELVGFMSFWGFTWLLFALVSDFPYFAGGTLFFVLVSGLVLYLELTGTRLVLDDKGLLIRYPFSLGRKGVQLNWSEVLRVESEEKDRFRALYVITSNDVYQLEGRLWRDTSLQANAEVSTFPFDSSPLYSAFAARVRITPAETIDGQIYNNRFCQLSGWGSVLMGLAVPAIVLCNLMLGSDDYQHLHSEVVLSLMMMIWVTSTAILYVLQLPLFSARYFRKAFMNAVIGSIHLLCLVIVLLHQQAQSSAKRLPVEFALSSSSANYQSWKSDSFGLRLDIEKADAESFRYPYPGQRHTFMVTDSLAGIRDVSRAEIQQLVVPATIKP